MFSVYQVLAKRKEESDGCGWFVGNFLEDSPQKALQSGADKVKNNKSLQQTFREGKVATLYVKYYPEVNCPYFEENSN